MVIVRDSDLSMIRRKNVYNVRNYVITVVSIHLAVMAPVVSDHVRTYVENGIVQIPQKIKSQFAEKKIAVILDKDRHELFRQYFDFLRTDTNAIKL